MLSSVIFATYFYFTVIHAIISFFQLCSSLTKFTKPKTWIQFINLEPHNCAVWHMPMRCTEQWRRQNFSADGAQPGHQNLDWGTFKKIKHSFLILAHFVRRGIALSGRSTCPGWPWPRVATGAELDNLFCTTLPTCINVHHITTATYVCALLEVNIQYFFAVLLLYYYIVRTGQATE